MVVVGHQGFVLVKILQSFNWLDGVRVNYSVPDEVLPFLGGKVGY
jgi:hypothetical protein